MVDEHESISRLADHRPKDIARMSQRLVNSSLGNFNGRAMAVARVQQNDAQHLLAEKLHICAGSIDCFGVVELLRTGVFGLCHDGHAQRGNNGLSLTPRKELP